MPWKELESHAATRLRSLLPSTFTVLQDGGSDSTTLDLRIVDEDNRTVSTVEVKEVPSAAGAQIVIKTPDSDFSNTGYVLNNPDQVNVPYCKKLLELANCLPEAKGTVLSGPLKVLAAEVFANKYFAHEGVPLLIAGDAKKKNITPPELVLVQPTVRNLVEFFDFTLTVRKKKSGSSAPSATIMNPLVVDGIATKVGKYYFIANENPATVAAANLAAQQHGLYINANNEFRKLGTTNNLNVLLNFVKGQNYPSSGHSDAEMRTVLQVLFT